MKKYLLAMIISVCGMNVQAVTDSTKSMIAEGMINNGYYAKWIGQTLQLKEQPNAKDNDNFAFLVCLQLSDVMMDYKIEIVSSTFSWWTVGSFDCTRANLVSELS
jgi:hypothetical protein